MRTGTDARKCVLIGINPQVNLPNCSSRDLVVWLTSAAEVLDLKAVWIQQDSLDALLLNVGFEKSDGGRTIENRSSLLLMGSDLKSSITHLALEALVEGFDVYLLGDLIFCSDKSHENLYWQRLIQAGAIPTTMAQMFSEWLANASSQSAVDVMRKYIKEFSGFSDS